jgi:hypothetical protein
MDACTRPSHTGRQTKEPTRSRLAAFLWCASLILASLVLASPALPATSPDVAPENEETASISPSAEHEIAIRKVKPGFESATLVARLTDATTALAKNVSWEVRSSAGDVVFNDKRTTASMALEPGFYGVVATFGAIKLEENFTLLEGHGIEIHFVLNAGAVRILPRIKNLATTDVPSLTRVFALTGKAKGNLVKESHIPGEIISLTAGHYRIESRLSLGNALSVLDVKVRPGVISAVEIDHRVGIARLAYVGAPHAKVKWEILRGPVMELQDISGLNASITLRPGEYTAVAKVGSERLTATFQIVEGEARDIILGN